MSSSSPATSYFALHSGLTVMRRLGINIATPLALCQRMDGRLGLFTEKSVPMRFAEFHDPRDDNSNAIMAVPLSSTLHRFQRNFKPAPQAWRLAGDVASTVNFATYFEMTSLDLGGDDGDTFQAHQRSVDEQRATLQRSASVLQERKWLEGSAALFIASSVVLAERHRKLERFLPADPAQSCDRAIVEQIAWAFDNNFPGFQVEIDERGHNAPKSIADVEARYHIMQACSHLEASLMDAITTCELSHARRLFGERAEAPQTFTEVVSKAVETTIFGGIFCVPFKNAAECLLRRKHAVEISDVTTKFTNFVTSVDPRFCTPLFYYAPYLSNINAAVEVDEANCVIDRDEVSGHLVLKLLRPLRAGEELIKLEPRNVV